MNIYLLLNSKDPKGEYFHAYIFINEFKLLLRDTSRKRHLIITFYKKKLNTKCRIQLQIFPLQMSKCKLEMKSRCLNLDVWVPFEMHRCFILNLHLLLQKGMIILQVLFLPGQTEIPYILEHLKWQKTMQIKANNSVDYEMKSYSCNYMDCYRRLGTFFTNKNTIWSKRANLKQSEFKLTLAWQWLRCTILDGGETRKGKNVTTCGLRESLKVKAKAVCTGRTK